MVDRDDVWLAIGIIVLIVVVLIAETGCGLRAMQIDMLAGAYDVRQLRGQDAAQTAVDVEACKAKLLEEPGQLEPYASADMVIALVAEVERNRRYTRCLAERGYQAEQRPMVGGAP